jgi:hypothetical protein
LLLRQTESLFQCSLVHQNLLSGHTFE